MGYQQKFICDYELALIQAIEETMPAVTIQGCFFHLRKTLRKNLGKEGLIKKLKKCNNFRHYFNLLAALAFVPERDVKPLFNLLKNEEKFPEELKEYTDGYYKSNWIEDRNGEDARFKIIYWIVHDRYYFDHFTDSSKNPHFIQKFTFHKIHISKI